MCTVILALGNRCAGSGMPVASLHAGSSIAVSSGSITSTATSISAPPVVPGSTVSAASSATRSTGSAATSLGSSSIDHAPSVDPFFHPASVRVMKRIPRSSRNCAATKLAAILVDVVVKNNVESWSRLFNFSSRCLVIPRRGGRRRSLVTLINAQLREERDPIPSQFLRPSNQDCPSALAKRVSSKLEDGDFRGAVRLTCSQDSLAVKNEETLTALRSKHPQRCSDSCFPTGPHAATDLPFLADGVVIQAIRSFPRSSAGGPDGLRPQHLVDLTSASAGGGGRELISALSSFLLHVLEGKTAPSVQPKFFLELT